MNCPICQKHYIEQGVKNHIIGAAKSELWFELKKKPHFDFYKKNNKKRIIKKFEI